MTPLGSTTTTAPPPGPFLGRLRTLTGLGIVIALVLATLAAVTAVTERPAHAASRNLTVSPSTYVAGQRLVWSGNIGVSGVRKLQLQRNLARPGDKWIDVNDVSITTRSDGSFRFTYPAPGMFGILFRVKSGSYTSPNYEFLARTQDLVVWVSEHQENTTGEPEYLNPGEEFGITVDTTPDFIYRAPFSAGQPTFPGRALTLQKRIDGDTWVTAGRTTVDSDGYGYFTGLSEPAGVAAYRVREEAITTGGNEIGWTHSFPMHLYVGRDAQRALEASYGYRESTSPRQAQAATTSDTVAPGRRATPNAGQVWGWSPSRYDFDWEAGQDLDSDPSRGTSNRAFWLDYTDGSGRVVKHNGGLLLDSKRFAGAGPGDFGTTRATVKNDSAVQGRWETRMRIRSADESDERPYQILAELVPARAADYDCGAHNIVIAKLTPGSRRISFGARNGSRVWLGSKTMDIPPTTSDDTYAVEVRKKRITWFINAKPVATASGASVSSGVPMTFRFSLVGQGREEMNQVSLASDWVRAFPINTGKSPISGNKLAGRTTTAAAC